MNYKVDPLMAFILLYDIYEMRVGISSVISRYSYYEVRNLHIFISRDGQTEYLSIEPPLINLLQW